MVKVVEELVASIFKSLVPMVLFCHMDSLFLVSANKMGLKVGAVNVVYNDLMSNSPHYPLVFSIYFHIQVNPYRRDYTQWI